MPREGSESLDSFSMVGAGAMAHALATALMDFGLTFRSIHVRNPDDLPDWAAKAEESCGIDTRPSRNPDVTILAVSDDALADVAKGLVAAGNWTGATVLHTSGVHDHHVLGPLAEAGASVGSFHPLQTFSRRDDSSAFRGVTIGIDGDAHAMTVAGKLANHLLATTVEIEPDKRDLYHAAAVMAGNHAITMISAAGLVWESASGTQGGAASALGPLVSRSVENALSTGPEAALTGPVVRADVHTIQRHLEALKAHLPHLLVLYTSATTETVHLALRAGRIDPPQAVAILDLLNSFVEDSASPGEQNEHQPSNHPGPTERGVS